MSGDNSIFLEIEEEKNRQALSLPAKRVIEKLIPLKSKEAETSRRWFWELLQNANDYNEKVDVILEVTDDKVIFKHSGKPFSIQDVLNMISPDSGKDYSEEKTDNIGKFGSGLLSTHILSSAIKVSGAYKGSDRDDLFRFEIVLDRSLYQDKKRLIESIKTARDSFGCDPITMDRRDYTGFMTAFTYNIKDRLPGMSPAVDVVGIGLSQIYNVLPYTLCFLPKVHSVEIVDRRLNPEPTRYKISASSYSASGPVFMLEENDTLNEIEFVKIRHKQVETVYRHVKGSVAPLPLGIAKLFCGLPMIGSEHIGLPFLLNSYDFESTIERDGVEITPNDKNNLALFNQAVVLYQLLLEDVANRGLDGGFHLTKLRSRYEGVEGSKNIFKRDFVPAFREKINLAKIVKNENEDFIQFSDMLLPHKEKRADVPFYLCAREIKSERLPVKREYEGWVKTVDSKIFSKQMYSLNQFVEDVSQTQHIDAFILKSCSDVVDWLKSVAILVVENDPTLFIYYPILPNQRRQLQTSRMLSVDQDIPDGLKRIYNKLYVEEVETVLLDKAFNNLEVVRETLDTKAVCSQIDKRLKERYSENGSSTNTFSTALDLLYQWINTSQMDDKTLEDVFEWFYPKRAMLFMDTFDDAERGFAFTIVKSGKIKSLAILAQSSLTPAEIEFISNNPDKISSTYAFFQSTIDDRQHANAETGNYGEQLVNDDIKKRFLKTAGFEVIWSSKYGESRFDFEIKEHGKTILYIDVKTTMRGISNSDSVPFFMRRSQWEFLDTLQPDAKYLLARVFREGSKIKYVEISSQMNP